MQGPAAAGLQIEGAWQARPWLSPGLWLGADLLGQQQLRLGPTLRFSSPDRRLSLQIGGGLGAGAAGPDPA